MILRTTGQQESKSPFILVVDDEKRIADTLALILCSKEYAAEAAYDGATALQICRKRLPDLIISDVVMPGMSGIELAITVSREFPSSKILLFSGQAATDQMMQQARLAGHQFELLAKPLHPTQLLEKVTTLLGK
jgi:CheY-like chemotaxis protein